MQNPYEKDLRSKSIAEATKILKMLRPLLYQTLTIDLSVVHAAVESQVFNIAGDFLAVESIASGAQIVLNEPTNQPISLNNERKLLTPFYRFFIINAAVGASTVTILIGRDASFETTPVTPMKLLNTGGSDINPAIDERFTPTEKANEHNLAKGAGVDALAAAIAGTATYVPCLLRVMVALSAASVFNATITKAANTQTVALNGGFALAANALYLFDLLVHDGDTVNFQAVAAVTYQVLRVQEIRGGTE